MKKNFDSIPPFPRVHEKADKCVHAYRDEIMKRSAPWKKKKILDVGPGMGSYTAFLARNNNSVTAIDIENLVLSEYKDFFTLIMYKRGGKFPIKDNSIDIVTNFDVIEHIENEELFVSEIYRVLKPGGQILVATPNRHRVASLILKLIGRGDVFPKVMQVRGIGGRSVHEREYTASELKKLFTKHGFKKIKVSGCWMGLRGTLNVGTNKFILPQLAQTIFLEAEK